MTLSFVTDWLCERYISVTKYPTIHGSRLVGFYIYASLRKWHVKFEGSVQSGTLSAMFCSAPTFSI